MKTLSDYPNLRQQRQQLLQQLSGLQELRRGSLTEQFLMVKRKDGSRVKRGPYPLLTRKHGQKTVSRRLTAPAEVILCQCGQRMGSRGRRGNGLLTTLGRVPFARSFYQCPPCSQGRFPDDERLDIVQTTYSPGVRRLMARAGSQSQFAQAAA